VAIIECFYHKDNW